MRIIELLIDEDALLSGIEAISIVDKPAIEENFIALKEQTKVNLTEVDKEKRILMGAALVPNKNIYRTDGEDEYYIYFSDDTVRKASELFLMRGNQNKSTLEHEAELNGLSVVESWIIEDDVHDKSRKYGLDMPVGTWMVSMKVNNDEVWENYVKTGLVKGFSIEGYFTDKLEMSKIENHINENEATEILFEIQDFLDSKKYELKTFNDYPESVSNNAKKVLKYVDENGWGSCGTAVGKRRASQLASRSNLTVSTIKRMYSFLSRHKSDLEASKSYSDGCGKLMYDAWGGLSALSWSKSKLKGLGEIKETMASAVIDDDYAIINDRLAFSTKEMAEKAAKDLGCEGHHEHELDGKTWYMPCKQHTLAEVDSKGNVKKSPKAPKSGTPNKNPKGKGTAKGDASGKTGAKVSAKDRASLKKKSDEFNKKYKSKLGYGVTTGVLASVFQRGLGAFNTSHSPKVRSASQWAFARVNAYLYLIKNGRPQNPKYTTDYDLLPKKHPKSRKA
tara:strand:+ start:2100 stop:3614 length:1515 start_codon:yes stop_codon:yes gene_type:complete